MAPLSSLLELRFYADALAFNKAHLKVVWGSSRGSRGRPSEGLERPESLRRARGDTP